MPDFTVADYVLMLVVTGMSAGMAYVHSPRAKSLIYMLPIPFSTALVATGRGVDATHVIGFAAVWLFLWIVWWLHGVRRWPIVLADAAALAVFLAICKPMAGLAPHGGLAGEAWFWGSACALLAAGVAGLRLPHREEPGQTSALPVYVKAPLILLLIVALLLAKDSLRGFMPAFPMVTLFGAYEARRSLYTLAARLSILVCGIVPLLAILHVLLPAVAPIGGARYLIPLAVAWAVYLAIYRGLDAAAARRSG